MSLDYATLDQLRQSHPAWRLLRSDHAALVLSFLQRVFIMPNVREMPQADLAESLEDELFALRERDSKAAFPKSALDYLNDWASPEKGWLRKFYRAGSDEPHFDLTPATEKAIAWLDTLVARSFVGTESRLLTLFELLKQMNTGSETDPEARVAELRKRRGEIDAEISCAEQGEIEPLNDTALKDRFQQFIALASELLADFREVEHNFRGLDRRVRERIALWDGAKGALLQEIMGERDAIADSDQGRSFRAFWDFLMSSSRQEELSTLLEHVLALPPIAELKPAARTRRVHYDWLEAGEHTQRTVARLSQQLRRFLDDQAWLENRRIMEILRGIESKALAMRDSPPSGTVMIVADIAKLRKRLRDVDAHLFDSFPPYGAWFRRRFGIENEQALELFHQTVSMKSVGNLTDFVRLHMLEPFDSAPRVAALIAHFDDLNRAHEAVLKAKRQVELLTPLTADCDRHTSLGSEVLERRACREALRPYFAQLKLDMLERRLADLASEWARQQAHVERLSELNDKQCATEAELKKSIAENGGDRIERLTADIRSKEADRAKRLEKAERYAKLVQAVGETPVDTESGFVALRQRFVDMDSGLKIRESELQNALTENSVAFRQEKQVHDELSAEISSLKARRSNIPGEQVAMRAALCRALGLSEDVMPFVGELLQVREEEQVWEGVAERLLRNFGLSLLVPDENYAKVAAWVDSTHLKGRLVYFRVKQSARADAPTLGPDALARKLAVKSDSPFYDWLERELAHRFTVVCCETQEQFRREKSAVTRAGQIKMPGERHEKDDRHRLEDRSRYVLGWTNAAKIATLETNAKKIEGRLRELGGVVATIQAGQQTFKERLTSLSRLDEYVDFREIDWRSLATEIAQLVDEKHQLESASDVLKQLTVRLNEALLSSQATETKLEEHKVQRTKAEQKKSDAKVLQTQTKAVLNDPAATDHAASFQKLDVLRGEALGEHQLTVESCDNREHEFRIWLQSRIDAASKKLDALRDKIIQAMSAYKEEFKLETAEIDASVEAGFEYRNMLNSLSADDLPRFEARFKELLNENTIREVANFQS